MKKILIQVSLLFFKEVTKISIIFLAGMIVANDVDKKRCYMLIHQTLKRMKNANTVVINEDATRLPDMEMVFYFFFDF